MQRLKLTDAARHDLRMAMQRTGHVLTIEDVPDLLELAFRDARLCDPFDDDYNLFSSLPRFVRGWAIYPLTLGKITFLSDVIFPRYGEKTIQGCAAIVSLLHLPNDGAALKAYFSRECGEIIAEMMHDYWACPLRNGEIEDVTAACFAEISDSAEGKEKKADDTPSGYGPVISALAAEFKQPADFWVWECSFEQLRSCVLHIQRNNDAEIMQAKRAGAKIPMAVPRLQAIMDYQTHLRAMEAKWQHPA